MTAQGASTAIQALARRRSQSLTAHRNGKWRWLEVLDREPTDETAADRAAGSNERDIEWEEDHD